MGSTPDTTLGPHVFGANYFSNTFPHKERSTTRMILSSTDINIETLTCNKSLRWKESRKRVNEVVREIDADLAATKYFHGRDRAVRALS
jgi:hypothetical protein